MNFLSKPILTAKDNILLEKINLKISSFKNFNIFTHKNPDGDAVGSILALYHILTAKEKTVKIFIFDSADERFSFFPDFDKIKITKNPELLDNALIIYVDCFLIFRLFFFPDFVEKFANSVGFNGGRGKS